MAGASGKRINAQNKATVKVLRVGVASTLAIYILSLVLFSSGRTWSRLFYFSLSSIVEAVLWQQLEGMAAKGDELAAPGLTSYMFDVLYVTWFVHVTTALVWAKFWYLYLSIPLYALYRLVTFVMPYVWPSGAASPTAGAKGGVASKEEPVEATSKRQAKLKARAEKGPVRMSRYT